MHTLWLPALAGTRVATPRMRRNIAKPAGSGFGFRNPVPYNFVDALLRHGESYPAKG